MTEKKQQDISTSWLPYMFQINFALHFEFLTRELFVHIIVLAIFSVVVAFVVTTRGSHIPVCRSLLSESVQLTKCRPAPWEPPPAPPGRGGPSHV